MTTQEQEGAAYIKERLIREAECIALSGDLRAGHDHIQRLREQWKQAGHAGRDLEGNDYESVLCGGSATHATVSTRGATTHGIVHWATGRTSSTG